jgi:hypothetical protein
VLCSAAQRSARPELDWTGLDWTHGLGEAALHIQVDSQQRDLLAWVGHRLPCHTVQRITVNSNTTGDGSASLVAHCR